MQAIKASHIPDLDSRDRLLILGDEARVALRESRGLGAHHDELAGFLADMLRSEEGGSLPIDLDTVRATRLDKLLANMLDAPISSQQEQFREAKATAAALERKLRAQFRAEYFELDQHRYAALTRTGLLRDVVYNAAGKDQLQWWKAHIKGTLSEMEGNLRFEPGHWWLNLACAHRDGIVNGGSETPTKGTYGVMAVPLITGRENPLENDLAKYTREGRLEDMHLALISQVGRQVRILRGYRLNSALAPKAGVRYDGLYAIRQYGMKFDTTSKTYRLALILERMPGQKPMAELHPAVPRPSQIDDWLLYQKLEGKMVSQTRSHAGFLDWKMRLAEERVERELWRRARDFVASSSLAVGGSLT